MYRTNPCGPSSTPLNLKSLLQISQLSDSVTEQLELQSHFNDMDSTMDELDDMSFEYTDVSGEELSNMSSEERVGG
jgi:hypothetical protein